MTPTERLRSAVNAAYRLLNGAWDDVWGEEWRQAGPISYVPDEACKRVSSAIAKLQHLNSSMHDPKVPPAQRAAGYVAEARRLLDLAEANDGVRRAIVACKGKNLNPPPEPEPPLCLVCWEPAVSYVKIPYAGFDARCAKHGGLAEEE